LKVKYQGSIERKLIGIIFLVATLTSLIGYGSFVYWYMDDQQSRSLKSAKTVGLILGQDIAKLVLLNKISAAADISSKLKSFDHLNTMVLHNLDGSAIFQYNKDNVSFKVDPLPEKSKMSSVIDGNTLKLYIDASYQDTHLGFIQLNFKIDTIWDVIQQNIKILIMILLFMVLISYLLAIFFAKQFTNPILILVEFLEKLKFVDAIKQRIKTDERNEYGKLYKEVNTMLDRMQSYYKDQKIAAVAFETQSGMTITDVNQNILRVNKAFTTITGYTQEEAIGQTPSILNSDVHNKEFYSDMYNSLEKFHHWSGEIQNRHKNGSIYPEHLTIQSVVDENDKTIYYVASFVDLTLQKESEKKLQYLQQYDALTGLANRSLLIQSMQKYLDDNRQKGWGALICFNLRDFKIINDAYGHIAGDLLLQEITLRLQNEFSDSQLIGRIGADEFAIWFDFINKDKDSASIESKILAEYLITTLTKTFSIDGNTVDTIFYVGISLYNNKDKDSNTLLKHANIALHLAKEDDKNIAFFDEQAEKTALAHLDIYSQLLVAIEENQLSLHYQLQYNDQNDIYGAEALIRWEHPKEGIISPDDFVPIAERTGLIVPIGIWIIQTACKQLALWQKDSITSKFIIAVNISAKQFNQEKFIEQIEDAIELNSIRPDSLKIELTESILVENLNEVIKKMELLREIGIKISLDDFGTGYSSLQYLKELPLDQVKIDQSFIKNMHSNRSDVAIIKSIILLSDALDFEVVAEGVETKEHYELLKELGCKLFQGYYFARPKNIESINKLIQEM